MPKIVRKGSEEFFCLAEILLSFVQIFFVFVQKIKNIETFFSKHAEAYFTHARILPNIFQLLLPASGKKSFAFGYSMKKTNFVI